MCPKHQHVDLLGMVKGHGSKVIDWLCYCSWEGSWVKGHGLVVLLLLGRVVDWLCYCSWEGSWTGCVTAPGKGHGLVVLLRSLR